MQAGISYRQEGPFRMFNFRRSIAPALMTAIASGFLLVSCGGAESKANSSSEGAAATATKGDNGMHAHASVLSNDMVMGSADAPVTIIEYASVTCPHCATFHATIFPEIKEKYVDTGQVRFVFREFPTPPVEFSLIGSVLARCAADKGSSDAYFLVLGALFKDQRGWIYSEDPKAELLKIASQAGMDEADFDACLKREDLVELVNTNTKIANEEFNITGTPSFVLGGEKITAASIEAFEKVIDDALEAAAGGK